MHYSTLLSFALISFAAAQNLAAIAELPACASPCYTNADRGSCGATDIACLCNSQAFIVSVSACVATSCTNEQDLQSAALTGQKICAGSGASIDTASLAAGVSSAVISASEASHASSGAAQASSAASVASHSSATLSSEASVTSAASSAGSSAASSAAASVTSTGGVNSLKLSGTFAALAGVAALVF